MLHEIRCAQVKKVRKILLQQYCTRLNTVDTCFGIIDPRNRRTDQLSDILNAMLFNGGILRTFNRKADAFQVMAEQSVVALSLAVTTATARPASAKAENSVVQRR